MVGGFIMEKLTRTKKYADLHQELEHNRETQISTNELKGYAEKLNTLDHTFDKVDTKAIEAQAMRAKPLEYTQETVVESASSDVLGSYLDEVKQYNREKGIIHDDDTQRNILKEIRSSTSIRPFGHLKADTTDADHTKIMPDLSNEFTTDIPFIKEADINNTISFEIQKLLQENKDGVYEAPSESNIFEEIKKRDLEEMNYQEDSAVEKPYTRLMNETVQMVIDDPKSDEDEYDVEYDEKPSNRIVNFILVIFILIMLVVLAVIVYFILVNKGII